MWAVVKHSSLFGTLPANFQQDRLRISPPSPLGVLENSLYGFVEVIGRYHHAFQSLLIRETTGLRLSLAEHEQVAAQLRQTIAANEQAVAELRQSVAEHEQAARNLRQSIATH